jgi:hypothetical protein
VAIYRQMREEQPKGSLPFYLRDCEARALALELQEQSRRQDESDLVAELLAPILDEHQTDSDGGELRVHRSSVSFSHLRERLIGLNVRVTGGDTGLKVAIGNAMKKLDWSTKPPGSAAKRSRPRQGGKQITVYYPTAPVLDRWARENPSDYLGKSDTEEELAE